MNSYYSDLPRTEDIRERMQFAWEYWKDRNDFIDRMRKMLAGENTIEAPINTTYKVKTTHTYSLASIVNEKAARFTQLPLIQVVPEDEELESRQKSSRIEKAINISFVEMERRGDGDVWSRAVTDAIVIDEGVERIERAPAAFWREVVTVDESGNVHLPFESPDRPASLTTALKKKLGLPLRSTYVPLENFYPLYEGPTLVESFETDSMPLRIVLNTPMFKGSRDLLQAVSGNEINNLRQQITVIQYVNLWWHAYYAMTPGTTSYRDGLDKSTNRAGSAWLDTVGEPILLYAYPHKLGQSLYNCIPGRFGGWKTSHNRIEGVNKGLLELNQILDEVVSQVTTNVRAKYWPTLKQKINPELRGYTDTNIGEGRTIAIQEGQSVAIYNDEDITPLFQPVDDPAVPWLVDQIQLQMARLGGSPALYGQTAPGVETGYHQSLQITQAEHLDEKIEQHLSVGAARRGELILRHIRAMDLGPVYVHATSTRKTDGKKTGIYHTIDPIDLEPLPRLDAQVRRPRPVDLAASIRAAIEASTEREGKGPLMSDDAIRESFLNITEPDVERHKILVEAQQNRLVASGVLDQKIAQGLNLILATAGVPTVDNPADASPAALEATRQLAGGIASTTEAPTGVTQGMPTGQDQPEQAAGREISNALFSGNSVQASI